MSSILVTGGLGFIGSHFIRNHLKFYSDNIINLDLQTYASSNKVYHEFINEFRYNFYKGDICDKELVEKILDLHRPRAIVHFAAESHVDRSIQDASNFIKTNVQGTHNLLECTRKYLIKYKDALQGFVFLHVSTDEVYGSLSLMEELSFKFTEKSPYQPHSPYAASKAASDHIVQAYHDTHNLPSIITNCSNNYGPYQCEEKFIPTIINSILWRKRIPIYGLGINIRDWLYVEDHCEALEEILSNGVIGEKYNIGGNNEINNLNLVKNICQLMNYDIEMISFVEDRKGHDLRYGVDITKIYNDLSWKPSTNFEHGLKKTIEWYTNEHTRNYSGSGKIVASIPFHNSNFETTPANIR